MTFEARQSALRFAVGAAIRSHVLTGHGDDITIPTLSFDGAELHHPKDQHVML